MNSQNLSKEIKKVRVGHVALLCAVIFVAFAIIGGILMAVGGRQGGWQRGSTFSIGPGTLYEINDVEPLDLDGVTAIEINTVSDGVILQQGDKAEAALVGQCRTADNPVELKTRRQGSTLRIWVEYPKVSTSGSTRLTVTLPDYAGALSVGTTSGAIEGTNLPWSLTRVELSTVSGRVRFGTAGYEALTASTTSGSVDLSDLVAEVSASTVSGSISLNYAAMATTSAQTVSGSVRAAIPNDAAFKADFSSVSGSFSSTHPALPISGSRGGFSGSTPGGEVLIQVSTTSGSFSITGK
jgi:hypothetical protein